MKSKIQKIIISAMLASVVCVATMIIKIPSPLKGYINLGDCIVLISGWILSPGYAFLTAGIGSALADLFSGYVTYIPATFIIKGAMALIVNLFKKKSDSAAVRVFSATVAEVFMVLGYFLFEGVLYGFIPSLANVVPNGVQGIAGIIFGMVLYKIIEKNNILHNYWF